MPSLSAELGANYLNDMFRHAWFAKGDYMYQFAGHDGRNIVTHRAALNTQSHSPNLQPVNLPDDFFQSMDDFGWPPLGYRNIVTNHDKTNSACFITSNRTAHRGLRDGNLRINFTPVANALRNIWDPRDYMQTTAIMKQIFRPTYPKFHDALAALQRLDYVDVALSRDIAMAINIGSTADQYPYALLFKEQEVGQVTADGVIVIPKKLANKLARTTGAKIRVKD